MLQQEFGPFEFLRKHDGIGRLGAAAVDGDYFAAFKKVHPRHQFPHVSLLTLGGMAIVFCLFRLADVVTALVVIRIMVQFLAHPWNAILMAAFAVTSLYHMSLGLQVVIDEIRKQLAENGIILENTKDGVRWKRK